MVERFRGSEGGDWDVGWSRGLEVRWATRLPDRPTDRSCSGNLDFVRPQSYRLPTD